VKSDVVVLGSANLDLVYGVERIPRPGETVLAGSQARHPGGKGLNQAVAAARSGAATAFVGAVGADEAGSFLIETMTDAGLDVSLLRRVDEPTGTASIAVDAGGENAIVVAAGANSTMTRLSDAERAAIEQARVLAMQLEIPLSIVAEAARVGRAAGTVVLLNAAPAQPLSDALLDAVDVLVVNELEAMIVAGRDDATGVDGGVSIGRRLAGRARTVVVTLGERGARWLGAEGEDVVPAPSADVVDTTGAGDAFAGVLAAGVSEGLAWPQAVRRAVVAGAIAVESAGAVPSIPTRAQIDARLASA
jgi:ribokinase